MKYKIKRCPFCRSKAKLISDFGVGPIGECMTAYVRCSNWNCLAQGYIADNCVGDIEEDAITRWNQRIKKNP